MTSTQTLAWHSLGGRPCLHQAAGLGWPLPFTKNTDAAFSHSVHHTVHPVAQVRQGNQLKVGGSPGSGNQGGGGGTLRFVQSTQISPEFSLCCVQHRHSQCTPLSHLACCQGLWHTIDYEC